MQPSTRIRVLIVSAVMAGLLAACGSDGSGSESDSSATAAAGGDCTYTEAGEPAKPVSTPPADAKYDGEVPVTIETSLGTLTGTLDAAKTPCTVNSFASLADQGYFDDTQCHRVTNSPTLSVAQCGDPTASGSGGPGYSFADELSGDETYPAGSIAMANSGPDTNGSQFFLNATKAGLNPDFTQFGQLDPESLATLVKGLKASIPDGAPAYDGPPAQDITITKVIVGS